MYRGFEGSSSIFLRKRWMYTATAVMSPYAFFHTPEYIVSWESGLPGFEES